MYEIRVKLICKNCATLGVKVTIQAKVVEPPLSGHFREDMKLQSITCKTDISCIKLEPLITLFLLWSQRIRK